MRNADVLSGRNVGLHAFRAGHLTRLFALQGLRIDEGTAMYYLKESGGDLKRAVRMYGKPLSLSLYGCLLQLSLF